MSEKASANSGMAAYIQEFLSPRLGYAGDTLGREIRALQKFGA